MDEDLEKRLETVEKALSTLTAADDVKRLRLQLWDSIRMSGDVTMLDGSFIARDVWLAYEPRFRALTKRIEEKQYGPGRRSFSREVVVIAEDGKPARRSALAGLSGIAPSSRAPMPLVDALAEGTIALAHDVFGARLWVTIGFAGDQRADDAQLHAELESVWKAIGWKLPSDVKRLDLGDKKRSAFVPGSVLAKPAPKVAAIARVILPAKVTRNDEEPTSQILDLVDGTPELSGEDLRELPAFEGLDWLVRGWARLDRLDGTDAVVAALTFEVTRLPDARKSRALLEAAKEALYSGWGMNLEWDLPPAGDQNARYSVAIDDPTEVRVVPTTSKPAVKKAPAKKTKK